MRSFLVPACASLALLGPHPAAQDVADSPCADTLRQLAAALDSAFEHNESDAYLDRFELLHRSVRATLVPRIRGLLGSGVRWGRESEVTRSWQLGDHAIALVRSRTQNLDHAELGAVAEHAIWAIRGTDASARIVLAVEVDGDILEMIPKSSDPSRPKHLFRCRACNYSIDAGQDWLMVPNCKARIGCLESLSFYSLEHDLVAELSIHLADGEAMPEPGQMLAGLLHDALGVSSDRVAIDPWLPPMYTAATRPMYLEGARCVVDLPGDHAEVHLATYGRLGYLMVVRGPADVVDANRSEVTALIHSFALQDPDLEPQQVVLRITEERQGGLLEGTVYSNSRYGVRFAGPAGFEPRMAGSGYAFEVRWGRPDGGVTVHLKALLPPDGMARWTPGEAERVFRNACVRGRLEVLDDSGWGAGSAGFPSERLLHVDRGGDGEPRESIVIRFALADDLLVIVEARAAGLGGDDLTRLTGGLSRTR